MADNNLERKLKEGLLNLWKNNAVFRENVEYLTQVPLRILPDRIILTALENTEQMYRYELKNEYPPPNVHLCIFWIFQTRWICYWKIQKVFAVSVTENLC